MSTVPGLCLCFHHEVALKLPQYVQVVNPQSRLFLKTTFKQIRERVRIRIITIIINDMKSNDSDVMK